jgi:hypothetical protein
LLGQQFAHLGDEFKDELRGARLAIAENPRDVLPAIDLRGRNL